MKTWNTLKRDKYSKMNGVFFMNDSYFLFFKMKQKSTTETYITNKMNLGEK